MASSGGGVGFSPVTFNDHAGNVWIITILSLIYSSAVAAVRAYTKLRMYGIDDFLIAAATVLHLGQSTAVFIGLNNGLGKFNSITTEDQWSTSSKCFLAVEALCLLILSLTKCSVLALVLRIIGTRTGKSRSFCVGLTCLSAIWGIGSAVGILVNCRGNTALTPKNLEQCPSQNSRWAAITAIDIATEVMSWFLVVLLSSTVAMSFKRKCQVVLAFSFRLPLIILSAIHYVHVTRFPPSAEPQFAATNSVLFLQVMVLWSFISATIPNLKNFMKSFSIGMGLPVTFDITGYGSGNMYAMHSMSKNKQKSSTTASAVGVTGGEFTSPQYRRPGGTSRSNTVTHHSENMDNMSDGEERNGSQELIINKEVQGTAPYGRN